MKVGDLIKFKATTRIAIYLGLVKKRGGSFEMYTFWNEEYGICEFWKEKFDLEDVEVISGSR